MTTPSGRISNKPEERGEREKKMPFIVATYVYASSQGERTQSARTKIAHTERVHCSFVYVCATQSLIPKSHHITLAHKILS